MAETETLNGTGGENANSAERSPRLLRQATPLCVSQAMCLAAACAGAAVLFAVYRTQTPTVLVYYFVTRPAFLWFGMLVPFLLVGVMGVRVRWAVLGVGAVLLLYVSSAEVLQVLKFWTVRARQEFRAAQMGYRSFVSREHADGRTLSVPLRVVSWNVKGGSLGAVHLAAALADMEPDIAVLQESSDAALHRAIRENVSFAGYTLSGGRQSLLTRFPVEPLDARPFGPDRANAWRVWVRADVSVVVINTHLSPTVLRTQLLTGWSVAGVRAAIQRTASELADLGGLVGWFSDGDAVILGGDFNLPPGYPGLSDATRGLKDCFAENGFGWGRTAPNRLPAVRADHVYVPVHARVHFCAAPPTQFSDHRPVVAEVSVPLVPREEGHEPGAPEMALEAASSVGHW